VGRRGRGVRDKGAVQTASGALLHTARPRAETAHAAESSSRARRAVCSRQQQESSTGPGVWPQGCCTRRKPSAGCKLPHDARPTVAAAPSRWLAAARPAARYWAHSRGVAALLRLPFVQAVSPLQRTFRTFSTCVGLWKMNFARGASPLMVAPPCGPTRGPPERGVMPRHVAIAGRSLTHRDAGVSFRVFHKHALILRRRCMASPRPPPCGWWGGLLGLFCKAPGSRVLLCRRRGGLRQEGIDVGPGLDGGIRPQRGDL
jgi:hypothetical protein